MGILKTGILKTFFALWRNSVKRHSYTLILSSYGLILQVSKNMQKLNYTFRPWGGNFIFFFFTCRLYKTVYVKCSKIKINSIIQTGSQCNGNQMGVMGPRWLEWLQKPT